MENEISNEQTADDIGSITDKVSNMFTEEPVETEVETKEEEVVEEKTEEVKEEPTEEVKEVEAPSHWPKEMKDVFETLDPKGKEALLFQAKNLESGYQRKYQEVSEERKKIVAFQGLIDQFQADKEFANHILNYKKPEPQDNNYGLGERPTDPYEALKYDAALEAKKVIAEETKKRNEELEISQKQEYINRTYEEALSDPLYQEVRKGIFDYIESLPESIQESYYKKVSFDPDEYKRLHLKIREEIVNSKQSDNKKPVVMEKKVKPPVLENGGGTEDVVVEKKPLTKQQLKDQAIRKDPSAYLKRVVSEMF